MGEAELQEGRCRGLDWAAPGIVCTRSGAVTPTQVVVLASNGSARRSVGRGPVGGFERTSLIEPKPWLSFWGQRFLLFTHGYGLTTLPYGQVTRQGNPEYSSYNIPTVTTAPWSRTDDTVNAVSGVTLISSRVWAHGAWPPPPLPLPLLLERSTWLSGT